MIQSVQLCRRNLGVHVAEAAALARAAVAVSQAVVPVPAPAWARAEVVTRAAVVAAEAARPPVRVLVQEHAQLSWVRVGFPQSLPVPARD
jgi:hypothetical protein